MTPEDIAKTPCRFVDEALRERYFSDGACVVERALDAGWLARLNDAVTAKIEQSRAETASGPVFDLEPDHTADAPRLRRLNSPCDHDPVFMELLTDGPLGDIAQDLLGEDVKYYQSKLNFKWSKGGAEVKWHQDQPFFPHTNHAVATFGVYLNDCGPEQGPLRILPGTHRGEIFDHYGEDGSWRGDIRKADAALQAYTPEYAPLHRQVRRIQRQMTEAERKAEELSIRLRRSRNATAARKAAMTREIDELKAKAAALQKTIPAEWQAAQKKYQDLAKKERFARLRYRRTVDNAYEPIQQFQALMASAPALQKLKAEMEKLKATVAAQSPEEAEKTPREMERKLRTAPGTSGIQSRLSGARRDLRRNQRACRKAAGNPDSGRGGQGR